MEKLIGSHNSLSYIKPRQWWLRLFAWVGKCQKLTISEQWDYGVQYFDMRIRFRGDKIISGHGAIDYDVNVEDFIETLNSRSGQEKKESRIRLMLEESGTQYDEQFILFVEKCKHKYTNLTFVGGLRKSPFEVIAEVDSVPERHCYKLFQDYNAKNLWQKIKGLRLPWPWYWAKKDNKKYREGLNSSRYVIMDFVELK